MSGHFVQTEITYCCRNATARVATCLSR